MKKIAPTPAGKGMSQRVGIPATPKAKPAPNFGSKVSTQARVRARTGTGMGSSVSTQARAKNPVAPTGKVPGKRKGY